jgi:hypothetical protein
LRIAGQVGFFREVLSQQSVRIFVGAALPRALRITEVDFHIGGHREALVFGHLQPSVPGQRAPQGHGELTNLPAQRGDDRRCVFAGHFDQDSKTRMSFHQGCDVTVAGAAEQIALPMTGNGAVFNFCRSFPNGDVGTVRQPESAVSGGYTAWTADAQSALFSTLLVLG